ncbi:MAG: single-stranded-DNA-specific exonuclease RecJ [Eubacteriaceae bacterium]
MSKKTQWVMRKTEDKIELKNKLMETLKISALSSELLINRGITEVKEGAHYLEPRLESLHDPFLMHGMESSVQRILKAKEKKEKICLYGDYDADGTIGVSILYQFMKNHGFLVEYFIPNRMETGYGLHIKPLEKIIESGVTLLITVDNGISAIDQIAYAKQRKMDIIITDHHECPEQLPEAYSIINPKHPESVYPFNELCGAGVALKLLQGLVQRMGIQIELKEYIECVAIATVADLVPLKNENRAIVSLGIQYINKGTSNLGIKSLMMVSELDSVKAWHFGFVLGPKINAAGRLGEAEKIVELFTGNDERTLLDLGVFLSNENRKRQEMEQKILGEALEQIDREGLFKDDIIVVFSEGWHPGVIGIVASRIQENYYCPVIVISVEGNEGKGSCRSVEGFNIYQGLSNSKELFTNFGGHALAAGFSIPKENILKLRDELNNYGKEKEIKNFLTKKVYYDKTIKMKEFTWENYEEIQKFEPTGLGNPTPQFVLDRPLVLSGGTMGKEKNHLFIKFETLRGVGFRLADFFNENPEISSYGRHPISLLCRMDSNEYQGRVSLQIAIKDIKKNPLWDFEKAKELVKILVVEKEPLSQIERILEGVSIQLLEINRPELHHVFVCLKRFGAKGLKLGNDENKNYPVSLFHVLFACEIFRECKFIAYTVKEQSIFCEVLDIKEKKDIQKSKLMIKLRDILKA